MYHRLVREESDQKGLERIVQNSWKLPATYFVFCLSSYTFFFSPGWVWFFLPSWNFQLCPWDQRLHQYHFAENIFSVLVSSPCQSVEGQNSTAWGAGRINWVAIGALKRQRAMGREWNQEIVQNGVRAANRARPPSFTAGVLAVCRSSCSAWWPGRLWFTNCFTNISSLWEVWYTLHPPQLTRVTPSLSQTCLCLQLFRKFSQRGKKKNLPSSSSVLFLSQHFPQVYLC